MFTIMTLKKSVIILFFLMLSISMFNIALQAEQQNHQRIISLDSEVYRLVDYLSVEAGFSLLNTPRPWSEAEILKIIDQLEYRELSGTGKSAYDQILRDIEKTALYSEENFSADISVGAALEAFLHTSDDETQWTYGFEDRLPFLTITAETWFNSGFYAVLDPDLKESRFVIDQTDSEGNYVGDVFNIPSEFGELNYHFPDRGFLSAGGENWNFQIGRDQLEYGNGETGKLLISSRPDYYDFFKLKGFADNFSYTWTYINLERYTDLDLPDESRFIADHEINVRLFNILTLSVNESVLFDGEEAELQYISPLIVFHNIYRHNEINESISNIAMTTGFNLVPISGLEIYGEFLLDEFQTWIEQAEYGEGVASTPNAIAYMAGARGAVPIGPGYLNGFLEYIYTSPWCYLLEPAGGSFAWTHTETTDVLNKRAWVIKPLGYEYGPDTMAFAGSIGYSVPAVFDVKLTLNYVLKGENYITTTWTDAAGAAALTTPSGIPEKRFIAGLSGNYKVFSFFTVASDLAFITIHNYGHTEGNVFSDFQTAFSAIFRL